MREKKEIEESREKKERNKSKEIVLCYLLYSAALPRVQRDELGSNVEGQSEGWLCEQCSSDIDHDVVNIPGVNKNLYTDVRAKIRHSDYL